MVNENGIMYNDEHLNGTNDGGKAPEKKGIAKFIEGVRRKYDAIRYSKGGKVAAKALTALGLVAVGKTCFDKGLEKGKASVTPTVVYVDKTQDETATEETPAEEAAEEQTV